VPYLLGQPARAARRAYPDQLPYLNQLDVDVLTFEAADDQGRNIEWIGTSVSKDKKVVLGAASHRTLQVERPETVADLIRKALKWIEPERLILSTDCGFGRQGMSRTYALYKMVEIVAGTNIVREELGLARPGAGGSLDLAAQGRDRSPLGVRRRRCSRRRCR